MSNARYQSAQGQPDVHLAAPVKARDSRLRPPASGPRAIVLDGSGRLLLDGRWYTVRRNRGGRVVLLLPPSVEAAFVKGGR